MAGAFLKKQKNKSVGEVRVKSPRKSFDFPTHQLSGAMTKRMKRFLSMRIFKLERELTHLLSHAPSRAYGAMFISFGILTMILSFIGFYLDNLVSTSIISIVLTVLAMPFLLTDKPLPIILQDNPITDYVFFEFFCMRRVNTTDKAEKLPLFIPIVFGSLLAVAGRFIPIWQIALGVGVVMFVYLSFCSPEFAFFMSILLMPYSHYIPYSEIVLCSLIGLTFMSFVRKVIYGKRVINIEKYDVVFGLMGIFVLVSGIFVGGIESFLKSVQMLIMGCGYILASNVITNHRLAERAVNSLIFSSTIPSLISIGQLIARIASNQGAWVTKSDLDSIFVRYDGLAVFLLTAVVLSFSMAKHSGGISRIIYSVAATINLFALLITGELLAIIAVILAVLAYYALKYNKTVGIRLVILLAVPFAFLLLPNSYLDAILSLSSSPLNSAGELIALWTAGAKVLVSNLLLGIGIGADSFAAVMEGLGISGYPDSANLFLELGIEAGVLALGCFLALLIIRVRHRKGYFIYVRNSQISSISLISGACLFSLLAFGGMNYIWSDMSAYYIFWTVFGIGSATMRTARREYDDLVFYYNDINAVDSSVIDVEIG